MFGQRCHNVIGGITGDNTGSITGGTGESNTTLCTVCTVCTVFALFALFTPLCDDAVDATSRTRWVRTGGSAGTTGYDAVFSRAHTAARTNRRYHQRDVQGRYRTAPAPSRPRAHRGGGGRCSYPHARGDMRARQEFGGEAGLICRGWITLTETYKSFAYEQSCVYHHRH